MAEVRFRVVDAVPHAQEWQKSLRVMVESVRYRPQQTSGRLVQHWPLGNQPIPVATAPQFEKASVTAAEVARLRRDFEAVDPDATYVLHLRSQLHYELDAERFRASALGPDMAMSIAPLGGLGVLRHYTSGARAQPWRYQVVFDNAARYEYVPLPRDTAAAMPEVYQRTQVGAALSLEVKVAGVGPGTRSAPGGTLRMAIQSMRLSPPRGSPRAAVNWPFNEPMTR